MTTEYSYTPGMVQLQPGDVVQIDKGPAMVTRSSPSGATCQRINATAEPVEFDDSRTGKKVGFTPKSDGRFVHISNQVPKHLLLERRGEEGLRQFLQKGNMKKNMVKLEPGDRLCYQGNLATVVSVTEQSATIGLLDGREFRDKRAVNDIYFTDCQTNVVYRFDEAERAANLERFLAARTPPSAVRAKQAGGEQTTNETETKVMAKKTKNAKAKKVKVAKAVNGAKPRSERKEFIWSLLDGSMTKREIAKAVVAKFGGDEAAELKRANDAPFFMRKAGLKPSWKEEPKADKAEGE